jgi:hypothetical protein
MRFMPIGILTDIDIRGKVALHRHSSIPAIGGDPVVSNEMVAARMRERERELEENRLAKVIATIRDCCSPSRMQRVMRVFAGHRGARPVSR